MDCSPSGSSVHGISQARILEWADISFSKGSSRHRNQTCISGIGRWILYHWATREAYNLAEWWFPNILSDTKVSFQVKWYKEVQYFMQIQIEQVCLKIAFYFWCPVFCPLKKIGLFVALQLTLKSSFYILHSNPLPDMCIANIFSTGCSLFS